MSKLSKREKEIAQCVADMCAPALSIPLSDNELSLIAKTVTTKRRAPRIQPALTWSDEPPTEPGPYLWESRYGRVYGVTVTAFHYRPNYPPIYRFTHPDSGRELSTRNAGGKWFGPIPLPEIGG